MPIFNCCGFARVDLDLELNEQFFRSRCSDREAGTVYPTFGYSGQDATSVPVKQ